MIRSAVLVVAHASGTSRITGDGYLRLPTGLRRRSQLVTGDRVVLAADPMARRLLVYPPAALDALLDIRSDDNGGVRP
ncbi:MAG: AbrB/MazE/SpoVT family DNA-binding domain-containing protein [Pseudonocardia sp.]|nr:AbrB/MazE/SpoVT family DNA-binding domain-containing protein [Pseudonocardia sp.]